MKLCIFGDRNITDYNVLLDAIKKSGFKKITHIISGHAKGSDQLGERYAKEHGLFLEIYEPDWKNLDAPGAIVKENAYGKYNHNAGTDRNTVMSEIADAGICLQINGQTNGSQDMLRKLKKLNKPVYEHSPNTGGYEYEF